MLTLALLWPATARGQVNQLPPVEAPSAVDRAGDQPEESEPGEAPESFSLYEGRPIRAIVFKQFAKPRKPAANESANQTANGATQAPPTPAPGTAAAPGTETPGTETPGAAAGSEPASEGATGVLEDLDPTLDQLARNQLRSKAGAAYTQRIVSGDIKRLNDLGRFRRIESRVQLQSDGTVILTYVVTPQPVVIEVQSIGNLEFTDSEIESEVEILVGTPVDRLQLDRACRRIEAKYREKGYYLAQCTVDRAYLEETGIVLFDIREGEPIKITKLEFSGNRAFRSGRLEGLIETTEAWLLDRGKLDDDQLADDVAALVTFYREQGYLDIRGDRQIRPSPNGREASVTFFIDEGPLYTLRSVKGLFARESGEALNESAGRFTSVQLAGLMPLKPGQAYTAAALKRSVEAVKGAYGKLGYTDVRVQTRELRSTDGPEIDLLVIVYEGKAYRTGLVTIQGDEITKQNVILREVQVKPERPLDANDVTETRRRLLNLNLFDPEKVKVTVQPPTEEDPLRRDVLVEVAEKNTGSFQFGAVVGSDAGVVGRIALTQSNFDIADTPESWDEFWSGRAFRGAGQTFRVEALPGTRSQSFVLSLSEPSLLDSNYSGSAAIYYRRFAYREFTEQRVGTSFSVGRRLGSRWSLNFPLRIEGVRLDDIDPDNPVDYFDVEGDNLLTSLGASMKRTTLDNVFFPTQGSVLEFGADQAGVIGGDYTFTTFRAESGLYFALFEDYLERRTVLSFDTRIAYIPQDSGDVPVFERLYLGGQNFRGFGLRAVSPIGIRNDTGTPGNDPVGGTFSFFFGPQLRFPLYKDLLWGVTFIDSGTVSNEVGFDPYRVTAGVGFRVRIGQLSPAPLAFDFAVPLLREDTDRKRLFTFTIDLPF
ncbi:MAG: BamA/TamA family outer membrane protein [Planctomycetota bacterium]|nr:BamA/TamA family outer membrane protein [Planctomycetota bacterium]